ncbi:MAG: MMPL family transporter [Chloroflexi bacterium]|nr:MMPL family transporter [Chloroflexota bacterium]
MFRLLGGLAYRFRWVVLLFWLVALTGGAVLAPRAFSVLQSGGFDLEGTESDRGLKALEEMGRTQSTIEVVFYREDLAFPDPLYQRQIEETLRPVLQIPGVVRAEVPRAASSSFVSQSSHTVFVLLLVEGSLDDAQRLVPQVRQALEPSRRGGMTPLVTGAAAIFADIEEASEGDLRRGEMVSLPLVVVLLLFVFGTALAALLPVAVGIVAVTVTLALVYLIATQVNMSIFTVNIATFLGLGTAIDYSLLLVGRFREELERSLVPEALRATLETAGRAIFFSAMTTALGMAGLLAFDVTMMRSIGVGGMLVVAISALAALTFTPAFLAVLGTRINLLPVLPRRAPRVRGFWRSLATGVMGHPVLVAVPITLLLVLAGTPFLHVELGAPSASILPAAYESRQGWDLVGREFGPGDVAPIITVVRAQDSVFRLERLRALKEFTTQLKADARVARVESIVDLHPALTAEDYARLYANPALIPDPALREALVAFSNERITFVRVVSAYDPGAPQTKALVRHIREVQPRGPELEAMTSGLTAGIMDSTDVLYGRFPWAIALVVLAIYGALFFLFRSVVLPLKAVIMNAVSIFASYGALVFVFQDGHLGSLLGISGQGYIEGTIPILLFFILFGLSMDYEVFLLARVKEAYDRSGDNTASVAEGLERTGRVITSAALVVILVAAGFATGDLVLIKALSLGLALAIAVDVSIVRSLLVPALMRLLGDWNWWAPHFLRGSRTPVAEGAERR